MSTRYRTRITLERVEIKGLGIDPYIARVDTLEEWATDGYALMREAQMYHEDVVRAAKKVVR